MSNKTENNDAKVEWYRQELAKSRAACDNANRRSHRLEKELRLAKVAAEFAKADRDVILEASKSQLRDLRRQSEALGRIKELVAEYEELLEDETYSD